MADIQNHVQRMILQYLPFSPRDFTPSNLLVKEI